MTYALPFAYTLLFWWLSTGIIFYLDGLPARTFKWSMAAATSLMAASFYGLWATASDNSLASAYIAFSSGLLIWGWQEISLYMGYVTGPRKHRCQPGCSGVRHFGHAIAVNLWHELAIVAAAALVIYLTWGGSNSIGLWTYLILWWMHLSARLNVFLGVRNVSEEFVPPRMEVLKSFLNRKPMNLLFPISITVLTSAAVVLFSQAFAAESDFEKAGNMFLGTLVALAMLEHWFLMLPLPVEKLFEWSLSSRKKAARAARLARPKLKFDPLSLTLMR
jgi:putative photosynthetic complex assembly protein 2